MPAQAGIHPPEAKLAGRFGDGPRLRGGDARWKAGPFIQDNILEEKPVKFFVDTADLADIKDLAATGFWTA